MKRLISLIILLGMFGIFAATTIDLTKDVRGMLPAANGGSSGDILSTGKQYGTKGAYSMEYYTLTHGSTVDLLPTVSNDGYVDSIWLANCAWDCEIKVYIDGGASPVIDVPLPALAGSFYNVNGPAYASRWIGANSGGSTAWGGYLKLPIPFSTSIHITLTNNNASSSYTIWSDVTYQTGVSDTWPYTQKLHAAFACAGYTTLPSYISCGSGVAPNGTYTLLSTTPSKAGRIAGLSIVEDSGIGSATPSTAPLEGDFVFTVDGSTTFTSSGFEDLFMMGGYFHGFANTSTSSQSIVGDTVGIPVKSATYWQAYRFFIDDPWTFQGTGTESITVACGDTSEVSFTGTCSYLSTVWYYTEN